MNRKITLADDERPRIQVAKAAKILGSPVRTVQHKAALGEIPGAAKVFGRWTFDEQKLRLFVAHKEAKPCPTYINEMGFSMDAFRSVDVNLDAAYQRALGLRPKSASTNGSRS